MLTADTPLTIATSRYAAGDLIVESGLASVRITLGAPKFPLRYELAGHVPELAPDRSIFRLPWEWFEPAFRRQLERLDWLTIEATLREIAARGDAPGVVLLCFENVNAGERCHRELVAKWIARESGTDVPELGDPQPRLFA